MTKRRAPKLPSTHELLLAVLLVGSSWVPAGCGQPAVMDDAYVVPTDAYVPGPDAPSDMDGDGFLSSVDCDDADPMVTHYATRPCTSACGEGNETCAEGRWNACGAPTDCDCSMPGATRIAMCGNCGMQSQTCTGGRWTPGSACLSERDCSVGAVETVDTEYCGLRQRLCDASCAWGMWEFLVADGVCRRGEMRICPDTMAGYQTCDDSCVWDLTCRPRGGKS